jgi:uracil-DNA glycosylase
LDFFLLIYKIDNPIFFCNMDKKLKILHEEVVGCKKCPRLVTFRKNVPNRASFKDQKYWRRPVPGYGDPQAWFMILGLAPAAHGANRTGRLFTGDPSAKFLMKALFDEGLINQPTSEYLDDGLIFHGGYMTAAVKCVPPENKPLAEERHACSEFLSQELLLLTNLKAVLALGALAHNAYLGYLKGLGYDVKGKKFQHGATYAFDQQPVLFDAYHPSPQNTYTGRLTPEMLRSVLNDMKCKF